MDMIARLGTPLYGRIIAALAGAALALGGCAPTASAPEAATTPAALPDPNRAPTFVSLNPCLDAILIETAAPEQILALSHYSRDPAASSIDPAAARRFGVTGGTAEEVLALRPDIVLASSFIAPATSAAFKQLGLRVESFGSPASTAESLAQIERIAALAKQRAKGAALIRRIANQPAPPRHPAIPTLLWQPGEIVPGEATLIAEQMRWAGFTNAAAARGLGQGERVSLEGLIADPPALLLIAGDAPGQRHPLLAQAGGRMMTARIDPRLLYCGGPTIPKVRARLLDIRQQFERRR